MLSRGVDGHQYGQRALTVSFASLALLLILLHLSPSCSLWFPSYPTISHFPFFPRAPCRYFVLSLPPSLISPRTSYLPLPLSLSLSLSLSLPLSLSLSLSHYRARRISTSLPLSHGLCRGLARLLPDSCALPLSMRTDIRRWCTSGGSHSLMLIREGGSGGEAFAGLSNSLQSCEVCIFPIFILALVSDTARACDDSETMSGVILGLALSLIG